MKKNDIKVGGHYVAKVSNQLTTVRVDAIRSSKGDNIVDRWDVTNLTTNRKTTFRSAMKFRSVAKHYRGIDISNGADHSVETVIEVDKSGGIGVIGSKVVEQSSSEQPPDLCDPATIPQAKLSFGSSIAHRNRPLNQPLVSKFLSRLSERPVEDSAPHLIVEARAGTGKTTTLIEGLRQVVGGEPSKLTPSPQQAEVWRQMALSAGVAKTVGFCAFNKSIATELQNRVPQGVEAMTMHSLGFKAVRQAFGRVEVTQWRVADIVARLLGQDSRNIRRDPKLLAVSKATESLVSLCKMNLTEPTEENLDALARHYEVEVLDKSRVFALVPQVLDACLDPKADGRIDYDDMIWLPVALDLPTNQYDLLLIDECQDLNKCQQELAFRSGKRLVFVGDDRQAIYGFAGADAKAMVNLKDRLAETERGLTAVPLTVTRRCGRAIVAEARKLVPDFEAHETCCDGKVSEARYPAKTNGKELTWEETYCSQVEVGDMVLCRVNAPLVSQCFRFLKRGIKANIQGRDIGAGLISTIKKLNASGVIDLVAKVSDWLHAETSKEQAKRNPSEARVIALQDRHDCLICFTEGAATVEDVTRKIESVFTDEKNGVGVRLSSIHKAKGLESRRVFLLMPKGGEVPHPMARSEWQRGQEMNLLYVATTRAIEELIYVR